MVISAEAFVAVARRHGIDFFSGVPCSYLKPLINCVIDSEHVTYVPATNEGDAVALASGARLGGRGSLVMLQNSGLGNAVNPLTSLNAIFEIPVLLVVTVRGEPGGPADEPQHRLMGQITGRTLDLLGIAWEWLPEEEGDLDACLERACTHMSSNGMPRALLVRKHSFAPRSLQTQQRPRPLRPPLPLEAAWSAQPPSRAEALACVQARSRLSDIVVATTGFTGRSLYGIGDRENQLYLVGSMGCAGMLGLGLALCRRERRTVVLDGDGAVLMRLGALATLGYERPSNLVHVLLDNEVHESTGGQSTASHSVDLANVARACGYPRVVRARSIAELEAALDAANDALCFIHVKIGPGAEAEVPRPKLTPAQVARRLQGWLGAAPPPPTVNATPALP